MATKRAKVNVAHDAQRSKMICKGTMNLHVHNCATFPTTEFKVLSYKHEEVLALFSRA